jgi:methylase of polypeptide subunit release factors
MRQGELAREVVFDGVPISVSPGAVMTPVPGTVALVDVAVEWIGSRAVRVADVGTGTGAVAVAVALRAPSARIWAIDDSEAAVSVARANVARHDLEERVEVLLGNLLEPVPDQLTSCSRICPTTRKRVLGGRTRPHTATSPSTRSMRPVTACNSTAS